MPPRFVRAFGETKAIGEWLADPRCAVSINILRRRLNDGWPAEDALTTPAIPGPAPRPRFDDETAERLAELARQVADGPRVHRHTPDAAPEAVALRARNDAIRKTLAGGYTLGGVAAATNLSDEQVRTIRDAA